MTSLIRSLISGFLSGDLLLVSISLVMRKCTHPSVRHAPRSLSFTRMKSSSHNESSGPYETTFVHLSFFIAHHSFLPHWLQ